MNKSARDPLHELVVVRPSRIHEKGLFAARRIPRGAYIGRFEGRRTRRDGPHVLWVHEDERPRPYGVDGQNALRYLNHSARPNAEFSGCELWSLREIPAHAEITIDYGPDWA